MFLGRAKKFLQDLATESEPKVQYFNVACASGHRIRGERTEGYQALRCPVCADGIFVLPRSPLPEPIAPPSAAAHRPPGVFVRQDRDDGPLELADATHMAVELDDRPNAASDVEIDWENDPINKTGRSAEPHDHGSSAAATQTHARSGPPATISKQPVEVAAPSRPRPTIAARTQTALSVLRARRHQLIFAAVPLVVVAAIGWRIWNNRRQEYPLIIERGKTEGIQALDDGNFDKAYQLLAAAKSAVDALGGEIEDADKVRQAADEAAIFVDQCSQTLEDMLEEAARTNPESWASRFATLYKGKSIVLDTWILVAPPPGSKKPYQVAYKVFPPGQASNFRDGTAARPDRYADINLQNFELFDLAQPHVGDRVTIGARLSSFQYDIDQSRWLIGFEPKSGVYMQHTKALDASGWADDSSGIQSSELLP